VADLVRRSGDLHARVLREWPELAEQYRAAAPSFVSPQEWERTFRGDRTDS
jgi:hypothetical protein